MPAGVAAAGQQLPYQPMAQPAVSVPGAAPQAAVPAPQPQMDNSHKAATPEHSGIKVEGKKIGILVVTGN